MFTVYFKYVGTKKFGMRNFFKDWSKVARVKSEDAATRLIRHYKKFFKDFEFKFE